MAIGKFNRVSFGDRMAATGSYQDMLDRKIGVLSDFLVLPMLGHGHGKKNALQSVLTGFTAIDSFSILEIKNPINFAYFKRQIRIIRI